MKKLFVLVIGLIGFTPTAYSGVGLSYGLGIPFVSQIGLNVTAGPKWTLSVTQNRLSIDTGDAKTDLTMPEAIIHYHPFSGAFYIGAGVGRETLSAEATDADTDITAKATASANTAIVKLGWMWGKADGGFWFGMDISYISPSGGAVDIDAPAGTEGTSEYQDVEDAGEKFTETSYTNITFAKLGYLF